MDAPQNAQAYADVDFSEPNSKFVASFAENFPGFDGRSVLDDVSAQAKSLQKGLGHDDHDKLEEYLTSVRELEKRLGLWVAIGAVVLVLGFYIAFKLI